MEAVVLAAGLGTRLLPLTSIVPKALLPIANRPLLDYVLCSIRQAGIKRIVVVTGHLSSRIAEYLQTVRKNDGTEVVLTHAPRYSAGPLYSFLASEKLVNDDFLLTPVDLMIERQIISKLVHDHAQNGIADIPVSEFSAQTYERTFVASTERPKVGCGSMFQFIDFETMKKSNIPLKTILGTSVGIIVCPMEVFKYAHNVARSGSSRVIDALNRYLMDGNGARCVQLGRINWFDVDTVQTLLQANDHVLRNSMVDEEAGRFCAFNTKCQFKNEGPSDHDSVSHVIGPAIIGKRCVIGDNSVIGPYVSIQDDCVIGRHVSCNSAIVLTGSRIADDSIIENAVVCGQDMRVARSNIY